MEHHDVEQSIQEASHSGPQTMESNMLARHDDEPSSNSRTSGSVRAIHFSDTIGIIPMRTLDLRLTEQKWYRKNDYKGFQQNKKDTLRHFRLAKAQCRKVDEQVFCLRGLEAYLSARAVQQKVLRKWAAAQTIMELQFQQRQLSGDAEQVDRVVVDNQRKLQSEYRRVTAPARKLALKRAALDAAEVKQQQATDASGSLHHGDGGGDDDISMLRSKMERLIETKASHVQPILRPLSSGPLRLRKTVPTSA